MSQRYRVFKGKHKSYLVSCNNKMNRWSIEFSGFSPEGVFDIFVKTHPGIEIIEAYFKNDVWDIKTENKERSK